MGLLLFQPGVIILRIPSALGVERGGDLCQAGVDP